MLVAAAATFADEAAPVGKHSGAAKPSPVEIEQLKANEQTSDGSRHHCQISHRPSGGTGTPVVHSKGWDDTAKIAGQDEGTEDQDQSRTVACEFGFCGCS